ncbi:MAG: pyruvate formate lyase family protein [Candidatus Latescibacterota bacterium]
MKETPSSISERMARLRGIALEEEHPFRGVRGVLAARSYQDSVGLPLIIRRARALAEVIRHWPPEIYPDEFLVSHHNTPDFGLDFPDQWNVADDQLCSRIDKSPLNADQREFLHQVRADWHRLFGHEACVFNDPSIPQFLKDEMDAGIFFGSGLCLNHSVRSFQTLLERGFVGIGSEIQDRMDQLDFSDPQAPEQLVFYQACQCIAQEGAVLGQRYAREARDRAKACPQPEESQWLIEIASVCERVPAHPARTFREALQSLWFGHVITCWEDGVNANSLGRLDQILYPYYKADKEAGRLTDEEALELIEALWIKLYQTYDVQQVVLSGQTDDGHDATNPLTYLMFDATDALAFIRCLSVRVHKNTPKKLLARCVEMMGKGGGIPFLFNDDAIVPALVEKKIPIQDARDYAPIGCVEITIPGKANPHAVSHMMNLAKCFELALYDGKDPASGKQLGPQTGALESFTSAHEIMEAYKRQVAYFAAHAVFLSNAGELSQRGTFPLPYRSMLTAACLDRGRDITAGGALYDYHSCCGIGIPNVADSLAAIRKLVFEEGTLSLDQLGRLLRTNYEGAEKERLTLLRKAPKYGNDEDEVDCIAAEVAAHYCQLMHGHRTVSGGRFHVHLFSFVWHLNPCGDKTGASPDGRHAGDPLAYSLSPMQGRDATGLTAVLNSLIKMPHHLAAASSSAIIEVDPALFEGARRDQLVAILKTSIDRGLGQLQLNVVTVDTLKKAQQEPETYRNLQVRVSGYSYRFCLLDRAMQDHIIARTKHRCA